jgi:DedD protein
VSQDVQDVAVQPMLPPRQTTDDSATNQEPQDVMSAAHPGVVNDMQPATQQHESANSEVIAKINDNEPAIASDEDDFKTKQASTKAPEPVVASAPVAKPAPIVAKVKQKTKQAKLMQASKIKIDNKPIKDNGLLELKQAAWVIQIGSFKNKANALRLVNQLRANGYRAFIQQTSGTFGDSTRVFVGPENKHHSARALADRLESDMHIRGIVISYKPLAL